MLVSCYSRKKKKEYRSGQKGGYEEVTPHFKEMKSYTGGFTGGRLLPSLPTKGMKELRCL